MRDISHTLFLLLMVGAYWRRILPISSRAKGLIGLALLAASLPFLFWPIMASVSKPVQIAVDVVLIALWLWAGVLAFKENEPERGAS